MSAKVLFACSKCFSRHPFEELSKNQQLCKNCRIGTSIVKCAYCRSEFQPSTKSQSACKKCEHNLSKYGKPNACECCKIVAAFGSSKCLRCASYEAKYGPPVQCDECKQRSAFDKHDENKKINGKLLCWLCTCAFKRALLKAQQEGRILAPSKKRPHEKTHRDSGVGSSTSSSSAAKKTSRSSAMDITKSNTGPPGVGVGGGGSGGSGMSATNIISGNLDRSEKMPRNASSSTNSGNSSSVVSGSGNGVIGLSSIAGPAVVSIDPNSADHVVAMTNLKERIASLEKRLQQKDKELLEKDKMITELKGQNLERENKMRNRLKEVDRLNDMKVENLNRKIASLLKEVAVLKKSSKRNGTAGGGSGGGSGSANSNNTNSSNNSSNATSNAVKEKEKLESDSPRDERFSSDDREKDDKDERVDDNKSRDSDDRDDKDSIESQSNSPSIN